MKNKRGYLQISFGWLFAIIVGAFILFLAIYGVTKLVNNQSNIQGAKTSKEIGVLLNPLETSFETAKTVSLSFPADTRIYNKCDNLGVFGRQGIEVSQKNFGKFQKTDLTVGFDNKYIFSESISEGKNFYIFSKPFEFPFKTADLIYLIPASEEYCFTDAPVEIEEEISKLNQANLKTKDCSEESISVCFGRNSCDINVDYSARYVEKNNKKIYFETDALMYAGIFSDKPTYECQLKRLMQRTEQLSDLYANKESFLAGECESNVGGDLRNLENSAKDMTDSSELYLIKNIADNIEQKNEDNWRCRLW